MDTALRDRILQAVDIVALIGERVTLTRKGKEFVGLCPFHPDHKPSLWVSPAKQIFKCFACGAGGDAIEFVRRSDHLEWRDALASLAERAGVELRSSPADRLAAQRRNQVLEVLAWAKLHFLANLRGEAGSQARKYALGRGLTPESLERHELGLALDAWDDLLRAARRQRLDEAVLLQAGLLSRNESARVFDRFRNRLMFPISDPLGRTIAFGGRTLGDDPAKYLNSPESPTFSKSRVLYGLSIARKAIEQSGRSIVVEGYLDCVMLHQHGFANSVATLGTALTDAHVQLLAPLAPIIYLCFDGDAAGERAADRGVEIALRSSSDVRVVQLADAKDPADRLVQAGAEAFASDLERSTDALEFKWRKLLAQFGGGVRARRQAVESYLAFVAEAARAGAVDPLAQNLMIGRLADIMGVGVENIVDLLAEHQRRRMRVGSGGGGGAAAPPSEQSDRPTVPPGLAGGVETVLGLLSRSPACWAWVDDSVVRSLSYYETWEALYRLLLDVREELGEYSVTDVMARCDDRALLELLSRAQERIAENVPQREQFDLARQALAIELNSLRMMEIKEEAEAGTQSEAQAFEALRTLARGRHAVLPAYDRWPVSQR